MREIIFRALCSISKKWVTGYFCKDYSGTTFITSLDGTETSQVNAETLGQYTGLKDKNDIMIFEGDKVNCYDNAAKDELWGLDKEHCGIIEYTPNCYSLKIPGNLIYDGGSVKQWKNDVYLDLWCNAENIEVIGNIHENITT